MNPCSAASGGPPDRTIAGPRGAPRAPQTSRNRPPKSGGSFFAGTASYLGATFFWGMNIPLTAILLGTWDPFFLAPLRVMLATLTIVLFVALSEGWRHLVMPVRASRLIACGFAFACFLLLYNMGLYYCDPITAAAIMAGAPVYAVIVQRAVTGAQLERGFAVAATLTIIGAAIAILGRSDGGEIEFRGGEAFMLLSFVCWNLYSIAQQRWFATNTSQVRRTMASFAVATVWLFIGWGTLWLVGFTPTPNMAPTAGALALLFVTAVLATGLGVVLWNVGVGQLGLATGSLWQNTVPVFGVLIATLLGFVPTSEQILGGAVVMVGVLWMQWRKFAA